jgi:hypothetical protein
VADKLHADLHGLSELSTQLGSIAKKIDDTQNAFIAASFDIGSLDVEGALESFERTWDVGRRRIHDDIDALGTMLSDSVATYEQADQQIAQALAPEPSTERGGRGRAAV